MACRKFCLLLLFVSVAAISFATPAAAETIRVPLPIWILLEFWGLIRFLASSFWGLIGFVAFIPLKKILLGAVLTIGGAFLPDVPIRKSKSARSENGSVNVDATQGKFSFKGTPRYAVLLVGVLIVLSAIWDGASGYQ